jgi:DNA-binding protein HU-beta
MNRAELLEAIEKTSGVSGKVADSVLRAFIDVTEKAVKKGDSVTLVGFGTFSQTKRKARTARNPRTGESIKVAAKKAPVFKAGKSFKDIVNGKAAPEKKADKKVAKPAAKAKTKAVKTAEKPAKTGKKKK